MPLPGANFFGLGSPSTCATWRIWDENAFSLIEGLIRYDLNFDELRVRIERMSQWGSPCRERFRWSLDIRRPIPEAGKIA